MLRGAARDRVAVATPGPKEYAGEATRELSVVRLDRVFFFFLPGLVNPCCGEISAGLLCWRWRLVAWR